MGQRHTTRDEAPPDIPGRYTWIVTGGDKWIIYDQEDPEAWIQGDNAVTHDAAR